jgi:hypothetical protein
MRRRCRLGKGFGSRKIQAVDNGKGRRKRLEKGVGCGGHINLLPS